MKIPCYHKFIIDKYKKWYYCKKCNYEPLPQDLKKIRCENCGCIQYADINYGVECKECGKIGMAVDWVLKKVGVDKVFIDDELPF